MCGEHDIDDGDPCWRKFGIAIYRTGPSTRIRNVPDRPRRSRAQRVLSVRRGLPRGDRKSVVWGKSVSVRVDLGGRRNIKNKNKIQNNPSKKSRKTKKEKR